MHEVSSSRDFWLVDLKALRAWECLASALGEDLAEAVRKYHLPDFSHWKNHAAFEAACAPLVFHFRLHLIPV